jgi:hypothetical protein
MIVPTRYSYVFTADGLNNIIRGSTQKFSDDGELVHMVLSREQWLALKHLSEDAPRTPDINLNVVLLPCEHDLGGSVVSGGDVTRHLGILYTGETEVADLEITVLVDENVARLQIAVDDTGGVDIFQTTLLAVSQEKSYLGILPRTKIW